jgi:hypothetical protein
LKQPKLKNMKQGIHMAGVAGVLLLALLVMLAGLYMLAHTKKENLNKFYSISALVAVIFAVSVFVFGVVGGIMCATCGKCHHERGGKMKHRMMMQQCMRGMHGGGHNMMMDCRGGGCEMGDENCQPGECGPQMKMRHHRHGDIIPLEKEIIKIEDKDKKRMEVEVKTEKKEQ